MTAKKKTAVIVTPEGAVTPEQIARVIEGWRQDAEKWRAVQHLLAQVLQTPAP